MRSIININHHQNYRQCAQLLKKSFIPFLALPLIFFGKEYRCLFAIFLLSFYWIGEVLPLGITSLIPLFLFPFLQIVPSKEICTVYFKDSIVLFMSTLIMAMAVQSTGLHRRIALKLLSKVGANKPVMLLEFMLITCFISFFVSDTACTALMCPTAMAILKSINDAEKKNDEECGDNSNSATTKKSKCNDGEPTRDEMWLRIDSMTKRDAGFCRAMILACSHASLIGGTAILTSTGPNLLFRENIQTRYDVGDGDDDDHITITYLQWIIFAFPVLILYILSSYIVLVSYFMGPNQLFQWFKHKSRNDDNEQQQQQQQQHINNRKLEKNILTMYEKLGPITFAEKSVFTCFLLLISLWISRDPGFTEGWSTLLPDPHFISDSSIGICIACLMFIWPKNPFGKDAGRSSTILEWSDMKTKFSWSCTLLIGAGYAISKAVETSELSKLMSCGMQTIFKKMSPFPLQLTVTTTIVIMTEFASNVSTAGIFIPISLDLAESMGIHPFYLSLPTTVACSFAFMLPISTPPNAIVYDTKLISMIDMIVCGFFLNILCILVTSLNMNTWTYFIFDLGQFPSGIQVHNQTRNIC